MKNVLLPTLIVFSLVSCGSTPGNKIIKLTDKEYEEIARIPLAPKAPFYPSEKVKEVNGIPFTRVLQEPIADELEMFKLVNEVRTKGTLENKKISHSCVVSQFSPNNFLSYAGPLSLSAQKHSNYLVQEGYFAHRELEEHKESQYFYGRELKDRIKRAIKDAKLPEIYDIATAIRSENVIGYNNDVNFDSQLNSEIAKVVYSFITSESHCKNLMNPKYKYVGFGYSRNYLRDRNNASFDKQQKFENVWVQVFSVDNIVNHK